MAADLLEDSLVQNNVPKGSVTFDPKMDDVYRCVSTSKCIESPGPCPSYSSAGKGRTTTMPVASLSCEIDLETSKLTYVSTSMFP